RRKTTDLIALPFTPWGRADTRACTRSANAPALSARLSSRAAITRAWFMTATPATPHSGSFEGRPGPPKGPGLALCGAPTATKKEQSGQRLNKAGIDDMYLSDETETSCPNPGLPKPPNV